MLRTKKKKNEDKEFNLHKILSEVSNFNLKSLRFL